MNKVILLCAAGLTALSVTGCNTCCDRAPCCGPNPTMVPMPMDGGYYAPPAHPHPHHKHVKHHKKHHPHHHKAPCATTPTTNPKQG